MLRFGLLGAALLAPMAVAGCSDSGDKAEDPGFMAGLGVEDIYNRGVDALNAGRYKTAEKLFDKVAENFPYSAWAANALLMAGYAQYLEGSYADAVTTLERFTQLHPTSKSIAYAYYLRALCYYEQMSDIDRDQKNTALALGALKEVVNRFPDSAYARDARLKIDLCSDHLAAAEMSIGRWYESRHLYAAAINRFQRVVDDYQTTNHVPEALYRLTEIYLALGMTAEAKRTAAVLAYNYPGSSWYRHSFDRLVADGDVKPPATAQQGGFLARSFDWLF